MLRSLPLLLLASLIVGCGSAPSPVPSSSRADTAPLPTPPAAASRSPFPTLPPPLATASPSPPPYPVGIPASVDGQPVLRPSQALARARSATDAAPFLAGGWTTGPLNVACPSEGPRPPLAPFCGNGNPSLGESPTDLGIYQDLFNLHAIDLPDSGAVILRVHAHDSAAQVCQADVLAECDAALMIDAGVRTMPAPTPSSGAAAAPVDPAIAPVSLSHPTLAARAALGRCGVPGLDGGLSVRATGLVPHARDVFRYVPVPPY